MKILYTKFGETRLVDIEFHNMGEGEKYHEVLWVERSEDYYALMSSQLKHKKVAIVTRDNWIRSQIVR